MNKKLKICLLAAPILGASAASVGATTYAWITARTNQMVTHTNVVIESDSTVMYVDFYRLNPTSPSTDNGLSSGTFVDTSVVDSGKYGVSDVSSKFGSSFYALNNGTPRYKSVTAPNSSYLQYGLAVRTAATKTPRSLKFTSSWTANQTPDVITNWLRVGVIQCSSDTFTSMSNGMQFAMMKNIEDPYNKYIDGLNESNVKTYQEGELLNNSNAVTLLTTDGSATTTYWKISIWLEGTCAASQEEARGQAFSFNSRLTLNQVS